MWLSIGSAFCIMHEKSCLNNPVYRNIFLVFSLFHRFRWFDLVAHGRLMGGSFGNVFLRKVGK